jgi:fused signal recognition particle receptor
MMALFDRVSRIRAGLAKTAQQIRDRLTGVRAAGGDGPSPTTAAAAADRVNSLEAIDTIDTIDTIDAIEEALLSADVGVAATDRIMAAARADRTGTVRERVSREIVRILREVSPAPSVSARPRVVLVVGVNGTGKTTTVGKLANLYRERGESVLVCAADTFRAAAVEQLAVWADRAGVDFVRAGSGADPAAVAFDAASAAKSRGRDVVIVDTAGRLHTRANLMAELTKIRRVVGKAVEGAPQEVLLVLDATVGQNGLVQAREFLAASGATGLVLTKLDGTAKGGIAIAIAHEVHLPILYVGVGEGMEDLIPFDPTQYVDALFSDQW